MNAHPQRGSLCVVGLAPNASKCLRESVCFRRRVSKGEVFVCNGKGLVQGNQMIRGN